MRIVFSWLKEFLDIEVGVDALASLLTERGIEAEAVFKLAQLREGSGFGQVLYKLRDDEEGAIFAVSMDGEEVELFSRAREIPEGLTVLVNRTLKRIPTLEQLGVSSVRFPLVKPERISEEEVFSDAVIDFVTVSNRGDLLSHLGIAREARVALGGELRMPPIAEAPGGGKDAPSIKLENLELCPRYVGAYLDVRRIEPSPDWLIYRISLCGISPINNIVDLSNYVLLELGQPLHTFDRSKLVGGIIVRNAMDGERFTAINHVEYSLDKSMLVIADSEKAVAIAGVMGGLDTEISDSTTHILLESAYFTPTNIRIECKKLGLMSESSLRFGRGIDPQLPPTGARRFIFLMEEIKAGSFVHGSFVDENKLQVDKRRIFFTPSFINSFLGTAYSEACILESLSKLDITVEREGDGYVAIPPSWRRDLELKEDISEDVLRVNLFDAIQARPLVIPLRGSFTDELIEFEERIEDILVSLGAQQTSSYIFLSEEKAHLFRLSKDILVPIENPDTSDQAYLLPTLLPPLISAITRNLSYLEPPQLMFELGRIFSKRSFPFKHKYHLGNDGERFYEAHALGVIFGEGFIAPGFSADTPVGGRPFYVLKGVLKSLLERLGISSLSLRQGTFPFLEKNVNFQIEIASSGASCLVGILGAVDSEILASEGIEKEVCYLELYLDALVEIHKPSFTLKGFVQYPPVLRDIALLLPLDMEAQKVTEVISEECGELLSSIRAFDVYVGKQVPAGMKSVAFRLKLQHAERTLLDAEVDELLLRVLKALYEKLGIMLRDYDKVSEAKLFSEASFSGKLKVIYS